MFLSEKSGQDISVSGAKIQSDLNGSYTNGLFTMTNSNSFLRAYEILP